MPRVRVVHRRAVARLSAVLVPALTLAPAPARAQPFSPSACDAVGGNLVANCGFEGGYYLIPGGPSNLGVPDGYTATYTPGGGYAGVGDGDAHSGRASFAFGDTYPQSTTLAQALATTPGEQYQISFWAFAFQPGASPNLAVTFGGGTVFSTPLANQQYRQFTVTGVATGDSTVLAFTGSSASYPIFIDDLSVTRLATTTAPEPGTWVLVGARLLAITGVAARRRRTAAA